MNKKGPLKKAKLLHSAIMKGNLKKTAKLLESGADSDYINENKQSALEVAIFSENPMIVKLILDHGCNVERGLSGMMRLLRMAKRR